jgi:heme-degrading monooxygenase HmoA
MHEIYTTGTWKPNPGAEDAFIEAWAEFAGWASRMPGAGTLRPTRDVRDEQRFVSFGAWQSNEAVRAWKSAPDFRERMARVLQHVDEFEPTELAVVATAESGATTTAAPRVGSGSAPAV